MNTLNITQQQRTLIEALQQHRQIVVTHNRSGKRAYSDAMIKWWKVHGKPFWTRNQLDEGKT